MQLYTNSGSSAAPAPSSMPTHYSAAAPLAASSSASAQLPAQPAASPYIRPASPGGGGHGKRLKSVWRGSGRRVILDRPLPTEASPAATPDAEGPPSSAGEVRPSPAAVAPAPLQQAQLASSSVGAAPAPAPNPAASSAAVPATAPTPVVPAAKQASKSKVRAPRKSGTSASSPAESSKAAAAAARRVMPARLRRVGNLLEGSSLSSELAPLLGDNQAESSGDHSFTLPPNTRILCTTETNKYQPKAWEDKEAATSYKSYFDNAEVQRACRERAEIETPEFVTWDEMAFRGRKRFFEPTVDLSDDAYRTLQRPAVLREKRQRKLERDKVIKDRNKVADRIEMLKAIESKHFFPIIRAREAVRATATASSHPTTSQPSIVATDPSSSALGTRAPQGNAKGKAKAIDIPLQASASGHAEADAAGSSSTISPQVPPVHSAPARENGLLIPSVVGSGPSALDSNGTAANPHQNHATALSNEQCADSDPSAGAPSRTTQTDAAVPGGHSGFQGAASALAPDAEAEPIPRSQILIPVMSLTSPPVVTTPAFATDPARTFSPAPAALQTAEPVSTAVPVLSALSTTGPVASSPASNLPSALSLPRAPAATPGPVPSTSQADLASASFGRPTRKSKESSDSTSSLASGSMRQMVQNPALVAASLSAAAAGTRLSATMSDEAQMMFVAAEALRQELIQEAMETLKKYDVAIAQAAVGLEAILGEKDDGGEGGAVASGSGAKSTGAKHARNPSAGPSTGTAGARRPRYAESSTDTSDAESSYTHSSAQPPSTKRPRRSEPGPQAVGSTRRAASFGGKAADKAPERESSAEPVKKRSLVLNTSSRAMRKRTAAGHEEESDASEFPAEKGGTAKRRRVGPAKAAAAVVEVRPVRATVSASARLAGIQHDRDFQLARPLNIPFRTFDNYLADPDPEPAPPTSQQLITPSVVQSSAESPTRTRTSAEGTAVTEAALQSAPDAPMASFAPPVTENTSNPAASTSHQDPLEGQKALTSGLELGSTAASIPPDSFDMAGTSASIRNSSTSSSNFTAVTAAEAMTSPEPITPILTSRAMFNEGPAVGLSEHLPVPSAPTPQKTTQAQATQAQATQTQGTQAPLPTPGSRPKHRPGSLICVDVPPRPAFHTVLLWGCWPFTSPSLDPNASAEEIRKNRGEWTEEEWNAREFGDQDADERSPEEIRAMLIYGWTTRDRRRPPELKQEPALIADERSGQDAIAAGTSAAERPGPGPATKQEDKKPSIKLPPPKYETVEETHLHKVAASLAELSQAHIEYARQMDEWDALTKIAAKDEPVPPRPEWETVLRDVCSRGKNLKGKGKEKASATTSTTVQKDEEDAKDATETANQARLAELMLEWNFLVSHLPADRPPPPKPTMADVMVRAVQGKAYKGAAKGKGSAAAGAKAAQGSGTPQAAAAKGKAKAQGQAADGGAASGEGGARPSAVQRPRRSAAATSRTLRSSSSSVSLASQAQQHSQPQSQQDGAASVLVDGAVAPNGAAQGAAASAGAVPMVVDSETAPGSDASVPQAPEVPPTDVMQVDADGAVQAQKDATAAPASCAVQSEGTQASDTLTTSGTFNSSASQAALPTPTSGAGLGPSAVAVAQEPGFDAAPRAVVDSTSGLVPTLPAAPATEQASTSSSTAIQASSTQASQAAAAAAGTAAPASADPQIASASAQGNEMNARQGGSIEVSADAVTEAEKLSTSNVSANAPSTKASSSKVTKPTGTAKRPKRGPLSVGTRTSSTRIRTLLAFGEKPPLALLEKDYPFDRLAEYKFRRWGYLTSVDAGDPSESVTSARKAYVSGTPVGSDSGCGRWRALMQNARERDLKWLKACREFDERVSKEREQKAEARARERAREQELQQQQQQQQQQAEHGEDEDDDVLLSSVTALAPPATAAPAASADSLGPGDTQPVNISHAAAADATQVERGNGNAAAATGTAGPVPAPGNHTGPDGAA
ncbi:hypothetical protein OC842_004261 [Tilletia horrida]|uniref:Uncharacterized protein n=1 Tax=Tilletia horrida TaxID=155126 RepID=A0AAN6JKC8_9BASI|nr:hypothetical protein OC842_004261 [Tilletia horrida]